MANLKLKFDSHLDYQDEAISAVVDLFKGQTSSQSIFTVSSGARNTKITGSNYSGLGIGNRLEISESELLANLQDVQLRNNIAQSKTFGDGYEFDIEMETGTGKTYVYTKSMMELNKAYGFSKFIIVVPSIAIKEGVKKSLEITRTHFRELYDNLQYDFFIYESNKLELVRDFAINDCLSIMIINIDAFKKDDNIINRPNDKLNGLKPMDLIKETNPILIIDEPQSISSDKSLWAISQLNPLCIFRYSATHKIIHNMIYRLNAIDAYERKLVKGIEVAGFSTLNQHNEAYVKLISVDNKKSPHIAKIEVDASSKGGAGIQRKIINVQFGSDLESLTRRSVYDGFIVDDIYCKAGEEYVHFMPIDVYVNLGQSIGDVDEMDLKRQMIRKTIQEHLDKELEFKDQNIKVLSLFFIDRVPKYRDKGAKGIYAKIFEQEYVDLIKRPKYSSILNSEDPVYQAETCHDGYFSVDNTKKAESNDEVDKSRWADTTGSTAKDESTYNLIMKEKEKLLSFDCPLRFIFSHSALAEGWDNPNVFQICTLVDTKSTMNKRQKIGRGLRLCVNQSGNRILDPNINRLTVMANESFEEFADGLQHEYEEDSNIKFGRIESHTFARATHKNEKGEVEYLGEEGSKKIYQSFFKLGYINDKGKVQDKLKIDLKEDKVQIPVEFSEMKDQIISICKQVCGKINVKNNDDKRTVSLKKNVLLGPDFQELWDKIKYKTKYELNFDSDKLVEACVDQISRTLQIKPPMLMYNKADLKIDTSGVSANASFAVPVERMEFTDDLPDIITYLQNKTDLTRHTIVRILTDPRVNLDDFKKNPQMFMEEVAKIIMGHVRDMALQGIKYIKIGDYYAQDLFDSEELVGYLNRNMIKSENSVYEYTIYDSDVEHDFAIQLENTKGVKLYVKLPDWFKISTPIGTYNPDWAILFDSLDDQRLYFVFETKGDPKNIRPTESFKIECGKKHFKALSTDVKFIPDRDLKHAIYGEYTIGEW